MPQSIPTHICSSILFIHPSHLIHIPEVSLFPSILFFLQQFLIFQPSNASSRRLCMHASNLSLLCSSSRCMHAYTQSHRFSSWFSICPSMNLIYLPLVSLSIHPSSSSCSSLSILQPSYASSRTLYMHASNLSLLCSSSRCMHAYRPSHLCSSSQCFHPSQLIYVPAVS